MINKHEKVRLKLPDQAMQKICSYRNICINGFSKEKKYDKVLKDKTRHFKKKILLQMSAEVVSERGAIYVTL